jgi:hypothetical protein
MIISLIFQEGGSPVWFDMAGFAGMLPAGIAGVYLAHKRRADLKKN